MAKVPHAGKGFEGWCRDMAAARGGLCLAQSVDSADAPVTWRCASGHTWEAPLSGNGNWCPECTRAAGTPSPDEREEVCRRIVRSHRGGVLAFTDPKMSLQSRFRVQCCNKHLFDVRLDWLLSGAWCPTCGQQKSEQRRLYLELRTVQKFAMSHGGALLTNSFVGPKVEMEWRCIAGHRFTDSWAGMQKRASSFCPVCAGLRASGQGDDLPPARDPRGKYSDFTLADMRALAKKRGGRCLSKTFHRLADTLEWKCAKGHRWFAQATCVRHRTWCPRCAHDERAARKRKYTIEDCQALVAEKGGRCLSEGFVSVTHKLEWECSEGHRFWATVIKIKAGRWCLECRKAAAAVVREQKRIAHNLARRVKVRQSRIKATLAEMQERARALGGRCLSTEYRGTNHPLEWECAEGHRWFGRPAVVGLKTWCRICRYKENGLRHRRYTLADCREMARAFGGKCLASWYVASHHNMQWECAEGHRWRASSDTVRQGHWCRICSYKVVVKKRLETLAKRKRQKRRPAAA